MPYRWLLGLRGKGDGRPPAAPPATLAVARETLGDGPVGWAVETAAWMAEEIVRQVPGYGGGRTAVETLRRSVEATVLAALSGLVRDAEAIPELVPVEAVEGNAELVRRGVPLDQVLRGVRIGHACLHRVLMDALDAEPEPIRLAESHRVSELLFAYADVHASRMAEEYIAERDRWQASTEAARRGIVEDILAGRRVDREAAGQTLGYELARHHLAFIVVADAPDTPAEVLRRFAGEVARSVGGHGVLTVQAGPSDVWAWTAWPSRPTPVPDVGVPEGLRLAVGPPAHGVAGFRRSHLGAQEARDFLHETRLCRHADIRVRSLLAVAGERARWFAEETLGGLAGGQERTAELRETLRVYLASGRSPQRAAELLHLSRNTVSYRVKRAEEMLGRPLAGDLLELRLALEIARTLR
ncbi:PucR family transcriptional regulator [Thermoactinospora rubra]|uniref:PucR family transcriptional regulator n=1 Tax=Thermoactinospora rubra TaxID=1088767 RepID=UPI000A11B0FA|nr:helix-turn-helix domain-containing protein [Thermoactinospora rubra]